MQLCQAHVRFVNIKSWVLAEQDWIQADQAVAIEMSSKLSVVTSISF